MAVVYKPVYDGTGHFLIVENTVPMAEFQVSSNDNTTFFIAFRNNLKQQLSTTFFKRDIAPFVTDK